MVPSDLSLHREVSKHFSEMVPLMKEKEQGKEGTPGRENSFCKHSEA